MKPLRKWKSKPHVSAVIMFTSIETDAQGIYPKNTRCFGKPQHSQYSFQIRWNQFLPPMIRWEQDRHRWDHPTCKITLHTIYYSDWGNKAVPNIRLEPSRLWRNARWLTWCFNLASSEAVVERRHEDSGTKREISGEGVCFSPTAVVS